MPKNSILISVAGAAILAILLMRFFQEPVQPNGNAVQTAKKDVAVATTPEFQEWHEFVAPGEQFKVLMPTLPQHATETVEDPKTKQLRQYDMYLAEKDDGTLFMISIIKLTNGVATIDEKVLSTVIDDMLSSTPGGKLKEAKVGKYKEHPSIDFAIENTEVNIDGKVFLMDQNLYALTSVAKKSNYHEKEFEIFVNSFQLTKREETIPKQEEMKSPEDKQLQEEVK